MTIPKPDLEDKTFEQLVEEARTLIPQYAPIWTDHNWSDPGITLIDLQAWITEAELYRINLVTDSHRRKYLQLLGVHPAAPKRAKVDLTFIPIDSRIVKKGTPVSAILPDKKIFFEIDDDIPLTPITLMKVIVDGGSGGIVDRTVENEAADLFFAPFSLRIRAGCALYLAFDSPADSLSFKCYLYEKDLKTPGSHNDEQEYAFEDIVLRWEYSGANDWIRIYPAKAGDTVPIVSDGTRNFRKSGCFTFHNIGMTPPDVESWTAKALSSWQDPEDPARTFYWLRCVVEDCSAVFPPRIEMIRMNTATATEGSTIDFPESQTGTGLPGQIMKLTPGPVIQNSVELFVNGKRWEIRCDLDSSGPEDYHAAIIPETGEILFGDGFRGIVPPADSIIRVEKYRIGGGEAGNVRAGTQWYDDGRSMAEINNLRPAAGGADAETLSEAIGRFLDDLRKPYPAVNNADFEYLAENTPGLRVWKARAVPGYHPRNPGITTEGTVTIAVIPFTPLLHLEEPPIASYGFLSAITRHIDRHRLLCTRCCVVPAMFIRVEIRISVVPLSRISTDGLERRIRETIEEYLHPIRGWIDHQGWPMGQNVYRSEIYRVVEAIDGVRCSGRLLLSGNNGAIRDREGNLILPAPIATVYAGSISVHTVTEARECRKKGETHGTG
ncbi:MAG: hypothetical protein APR53_02870 [Methanoculleus sp. SDB]|nr:MAG: hypothetical protein APR53_02870 [Methanoculleus sp. SDB]